MSEQDIHDLFADRRIRSDPEFFDMDYREAFSRINTYLAQRKTGR
ncbi:GIY-YIG nuclease family protein [Leisingera sp. XS_AS12]